MHLTLSPGLNLTIAGSPQNAKMVEDRPMIDRNRKTPSRISTGGAQSRTLVRYAALASLSGSPAPALTPDGSASGLTPVVTARSTSAGA